MTETSLSHNREQSLGMDQINQKDGVDRFMASAPTWTLHKCFEKNEPVSQYIMEHSLRQQPAQKKLAELTLSHPWSVMMGDPLEAQFLQFLCKAVSVKKAMEIGVFTGYTTLSLALALPDDGKIVALDINKEYVQIGQPIWKEAQVDHKIDLRIGPALENLQKLLAEGETGTFDFVLIDADKCSALVYYELCLKLVRKGGIIVFDNTLWRGLVLDAKNTDPMTEDIRRLNKALAKDNRIDISFLNIGDGTTICRIK